jgi:hypothetical protein
MPAALAASLDDPGIGAMHARQRPAQAVGVRRHQDQVHMVRHQTPRPHFHLGREAMGRKQVAIERVVVIAEERPRPPIATLGDMVRQTGNDDTGKAGHDAILRSRITDVN